MESYSIFYAANYGLDNKTIPICLKSISDFADKKRRWVPKICVIYKCLNFQINVPKIES